MERGLYSVKIYDGPEDDKGVLIHSAFTNEVKAPFNIDAVLEGISSMSIRVPANNPGWGMLRPQRTLIKVRDVKNHKTLFNGRVLKPTQHMKADGVFSIEYDCEDKKAYLRDSKQRYAKIQDMSIADFFAYLISVHNEKMPAYKRFKVGNVTVTNSTDNVYRFVGYEDTYSEIKDNLIDRLGGYLVIREEEDGTYIDYLAEVGEEKTTPIRPRRNLKEFKRAIDPTGVVSRVIPYGARIEPEEGKTADASMPRIDAKSVNNGIEYFEDQALIDEFDVVEGTIIFDDINDPSYLPIRAQEFFESQKAALISYDITAINLDLIDERFEAFEIGNKHPISASPGFNIDDTLQIIGIGIDSENPQRHRLVIGDKKRTLSQYQVEMNKKTKKIGDLESRVTQQQQALAQTKKELTEEAQILRTQIVNIDTTEIPELEQAISNLNTAIDDLILAVDEVPAYEEATETDPGLLSSADKTKLNKITVLNNIDLDDMLNRIIALEDGAPTDPINLFVMSSATAEYPSNDGTYTPASEYDMTSDYILIDTSASYIYEQEYSNNAGTSVDASIWVVCYDSSQNFIEVKTYSKGTVSNGISGTFTETINNLPSGTEQIRIGGNLFVSATLIKE